MGGQFFECWSGKYTTTYKKGQSDNDVHNCTCKVQQATAWQFPELFCRIRLSKKHIIESKFHQKLTAKRQKGRRDPVKLQSRVTEEPNRLQNERHIETKSNCSDEIFISPIVTAVKKVHSTKLAIVSKILNNSIHKMKYKLPNIEKLIDSISRLT